MVESEELKGLCLRRGTCARASTKISYILRGAISIGFPEPQGLRSRSLLVPTMFLTHIFTLLPLFQFQEYYGSLLFALYGAEKKSRGL